MIRRTLAVAIALLLSACDSPTPTEAELVFRLSAMAGGVAPSASSAATPPPARPAPPSPRPTATPGGDRPGRGGSGSSGGPAPTSGIALTTADGYSLARAGDAASPLTAIGGLTVDPTGVVYATDPLRHIVWAVPASGAPVVVAGLGDGRAGYWGDGVPADATPLSAPAGLCRDPHSGVLVVADTGNGRIRLFPPGGRITTWVGGGSTTSEIVANPRAARLDQPVGVALDGQGRLLLTERGSGRLRRLELDGRLTTVATLTPGQLGPIAVRWGDGMAWVGEGGRIRALDPAGPDPTASPVLDLPGQVVRGLAYDQVGALFALIASPDGRTGARVLRLEVGEGGLALAEPEPVAGTGGDDPDPARYQAPAAAVPDARQQLLAGAATNGLAIDLSFAADPTVLSGHLYVGNAYDAGGTRWGQLLRLTPLE